MDCEEFIAKIGQFLDDELDPVEWAEFVEHERRCRSCSRAVNAREWDCLVHDGRCLTDHKPQSCLKAETIRRWAQNVMAPESAQVVLDHIASCPECFIQADAAVVGITTGGG